MTTPHDEELKARLGKKRRRVRRPQPAPVIHVDFRRGGRLLPAEVVAKTEGEVEKHDVKSALREPDATSPDCREPLTDVFSTREVSRLLGLTEAKLRSLDRASIVSPSGTRKGKRAYTFQDLIALRATHGLLVSRVRIRDVAEAIGALKKTLPRVTRPLQELRIVSDGRRVVVRAVEGAFEPLTGQLVLDFQVTSLRDDVVRVLRPDSATSTRTAYDLYTRASTLDEDPATYDEAEALYARAIHLDPHLGIAYTNLGNIRFRRGDEEAASRLYRRALEIDPEQPEAHYNIGYVALEHGDPETAVPHFEKAIRSDARFADAHFNLAMALEQTGKATRARAHWRHYLELEPSGTWAEIARQHLT